MTEARYEVQSPYASAQVVEPTPIAAGVPDENATQRVSRLVACDVAGISRESKAFDPMILELVAMIGEIIMNVVSKCVEARNPVEQQVKAVRNPSWTQQRALTLECQECVRGSQFGWRAHGRRVAQELIRYAGDKENETDVKAVLEENRKPEFRW